MKMEGTNTGLFHRISGRDCNRLNNQITGAFVQRLLQPIQKKVIGILSDQLSLDSLLILLRAEK